MAMQTAACRSSITSPSLSPLKCGSSLSGLRVASVGLDKLAGGKGSLWPVLRGKEAPARAISVRASQSGKTAKSFVQQGFVSPVPPAEDPYLPFLRPAEVSTPESLASDEEHLEILRERRGLWHEYAQAIPLLTRAGINSAVIDETAGLTGVEQNMLVGAAQVYNTLKSTGISASILSFFDVGGAELLYELRVLPVDQRRKAAEFVAEQNLDVKQSGRLARSMKEFERRKRDEGRDFFSSAPGDCLAFAYYRQSKEQKGEAAKRSTLLKALEYAISENARKKLNQELGLEEGGASLLPSVFTARLQVVRVAASETLCRPVPVLGDLAKVDASWVTEAVSCGSVVGPFRLFSPQSSSIVHQWAALPGWTVLVNAVSPAALLVHDLSLLPTFAGKESTGLALLVVDAGVHSFESDASSFFLAASASSPGPTFFPGGNPLPAGVQIFGKVLLALLPPLEGQDKEWTD